MYLPTRADEKTMVVTGISKQASKSVQSYRVYLRTVPFKVSMASLKLNRRP